MTEGQKTTCEKFLYGVVGILAGALVTVFATGMTVGAEREEFKATTVRSLQNQSEIRQIQLQIAEDRIVTRHIIDLLNEVRADVRAIRERNERD